MAELKTGPKSYNFEDFEVRVEEGTLFRNGYTVSLQDQPFRLLVLLVSRAGTLVTREEIQAHLWPANTNVEFDKSLRVAVSKLREALRDSASVPIYIETLPRRGYRFIRPVTASELTSTDLSVPGLSPAAVEPPEVKYPSMAASPSIQDGRRAIRPALFSRTMTWLAVAAVILIGLLYMERKKLGPVDAPPVAAHPFVRKSVAVLGLRNLSGSPKDGWLSTGLAEMLATELSTSERLRVISGEEVARVGLSQGPANTPSHDSLVRYANQLGADIIVFGSYTVAHDGKDTSSPQMRLDLRVENITSDEPSITLVKTGHSTDLFSLVSASGSELREHFGFVSSLVSATAVRRTLPSDPEAAQLYAEGLNHLRDFDPPGARDLLLRAARIEPAHAGTHLALADAWHAMGYVSEAKAEAARAVEMGAGLPREELLTMQAKLAVLSSDWPRAIDIYHSLLVLYPDDIDTGLRLVAAQNNSDRFTDAAASLKNLHHAGISRADEAKLALSEANTHTGVGDFRQSVTDADNAIAIAGELQNNPLRAQALAAKAFSLERLGDSQNSLVASAEAQNLYRASNNKRGLALSRLLAGDVLYDKGQIGDARRNFVSALELFREIEHRDNMGVTLERIGNSYYQEGALTESRTYYQQALDIYRAMHADARIGGAIGNIANVQDTEGDITGALRSNAECLALAEKAGAKREIASTLANMGVLEMERGNLDQASADFSRAAELDRQMNYSRGLSHALVGQGDVLTEHNDIAEALRQYEQAAKAIEGMDEPEVRVPSMIGRGAAQLLSGNPDKAAEYLQEASNTAVKNKEHGLATLSLVWLSRTFIVQAHLQDAFDAATRAVAESEAQPGPQARCLARLALARVLIAQGRNAEARESIGGSILLAQQHGYLPLEMELRILLARASSNNADSRLRLNALAKTAAAHGWKRIATDSRLTHL